MAAGRASAEALLGGARDEAHGAEDAGVDQHPIAIAGLARAEEGDVDDAEPPVGQIDRHLPAAAVPRGIILEVLGAAFGIEGDLFGHGTSTR